jgi:formylglycine-generating enzyme required for sulfatase activity
MFRLGPVLAGLLAVAAGLALVRAQERQGFEGGSSDSPSRNKKGEVTLPLLEEYLTSTVPLDVKEQKGNLVRQTPSRVGEIAGRVALLTLSTNLVPARPDILVLDLGSGVKMEMVRIKAGTFLMGSPDSDKDANDAEKPQHEVTITNDYYLAKYPVMQEQYEKIAGGNPSGFSTGGYEKDKVKGADTRRFPVERVSWNDAQEFCAKLSRLVGRKCELPSEAEWEFACRAGSITRYSFGDGEEKLKDHAWYRLNSSNRTHEVGSKLPNAWGLYDMPGNVWEWCADRYGKDYYANSPTTDPQGPAAGDDRMVRGGSWHSEPRLCRSAFRHWNAPSPRIGDVGFRVVVRLD